MSPARYLVVDVEATCCDQGAVPRDKMEIIEIGAVLVDASSYAAVDEFSSFVRPVRNPTLTPFCTKLTTISQKQVDDAPTFPEVLHALCDSLWTDDTTFASWGGYDKNQFLQDCDHHGVAYPFGEGHLNIKKAFAKARGGRPYGVSAALKKVGLSFEGTPHRGIDDARNIARLLPYAMA